MKGKKWSSIILIVAILFNGFVAQAETLDDVNVNQEDVVLEEQRELEFHGITTNLQSPQEMFTSPIEIFANVSGDVEGVEYKFVWQKNNWEQWGVIQDFSPVPSAMWSPKESGDYKLYVDVRGLDGKVETKIIPFQITPTYWKHDGVEVTPSTYPKKGEMIHISAKVSGNPAGLQYKFVWMKDDWKEWDVIQSFSSENSATWKVPYQKGIYKIYVDIKDVDGKIVTKTIELQPVSQYWEIDQINVNNGVPQEYYQYIPITTTVSGDAQNLQYKFVWMKDNWNDWGVIQDFSYDNHTSWYPSEPGDYKIYCDVKDVDGIQKTKIQDYTVKDVSWSLNELSFSGTGCYLAGDRAQLTIIPGEGMEGFQYKVVQKYGDNWNDWKVVQDFSTNRTVNIEVKKAGNYTIYVDVKDRAGNIHKPVTKVITGHRLEGVTLSPEGIRPGKSTVITPNISGNPQGVEYKYVWEKNGWAEWGVIRDFSSATSVEWTPPSEGNYRIYVDARLNGKIVSKNTPLYVGDLKNGWIYEGGYKFYYKNGKKVEDVRHLIGYQPNYEIHVNKQKSCVTIYAKDGSNGYIIPVVAFACSPGKDTPTGVFYTENKYRWHHLYGADGQFCTRIVGHVLFHSPPYSRFDNHTLWPKEYNKLGQWASQGCVRLRSGDAHWIYENCSLGTKVVIYNSATPSPFNKPVYEKIPLWQNWDPTDPYL